MKHRKTWKSLLEKSTLIKCEGCGQNFWPGSLEEKKTAKKCILCRKDRKPNPDIEPPTYDVVTEGYDPDQVKR